MENPQLTAECVTPSEMWRTVIFVRILLPKKSIRIEDETNETCRYHFWCSAFYKLWEVLAGRSWLGDLSWGCPIMLLEGEEEFPWERDSSNGNCFVDACRRRRRRRRNPNTNSTCVERKQQGKQQGGTCTWALEGVV